MLVLTRKIGESIQIGDNITIILLEQKGNQQKIGIEAPKNIEIHRTEIYQKIKNIR